ncbi:hypothetical protein [Streptomyces sp. BE133]|uniref:hypothetical protein n=1 Tax=Streptomyces sp. BE133 TaxID=3002523 RepID=UPI002E78EA30|nr:hypothetical protein [Streptomyces sp. BE133]MEE1810472.1 hypothetical protein [Streptomyces sp. BE133]
MAHGHEQRAVRGEDGHRAAPRDATAQGAGLHGGEVLGLVDDDVPVAPRRLAR